MEVVKNVEEGVTVETTVQTYVDLLSAMYNVQDLPGLKFAQKVADNIGTLEASLKPLHDELQPSEEFDVFAARVRAEAGNDAEKRKALEDEYPELVAERHAQLEKGQEMLLTPLKLTLRKFHTNELPNDITARQLKALKSVIN